MKQEYINSFVESSQSVIAQVTGMQSTIGTIEVKDIPYTSDSVVVLIGLTGQLYGSVIISLSKGLACNIASIMMGGMEVTELDEISKSAIAELGNMVMGNTANSLSQQNITVDITPPTVFTGENMQVSPNKAETVCIPHIFDNGETIEIDITCKEK